MIGDCVRKLVGDKIDDGAVVVRRAVSNSKGSFEPRFSFLVPEVHFQSYLYSNIRQSTYISIHATSNGKFLEPNSRSDLDF